jgi:hypothetical protein
MTAHLTPDELIDIAEGARADGAFPHVRSCAECRQQIADLRATMSVAAHADVPEPSPLFWDRLSARVREAVGSEREPQGRWSWLGWPGASAGLLPWRWTTMTAVGVVAAIVLAVYWTAPRNVGSLLRHDAASDPQVVDVLQPLGAADDPSLELMADLAEQMDPDAVAEAAFGHHPGAFEEAVAVLSDEERRELQRLLEEELGKS